MEPLARKVYSRSPPGATRTYSGVSDRSTQRASSCLRLSMGPGIPPYTSTASSLEWGRIIATYALPKQALSTDVNSKAELARDTPFVILCSSWTKETGAYEVYSWAYSLS